MLSQNGLMRCYNMVPSNFENIDEMTQYLPKLKDMGINVVWMNPIQLAGQMVVEKADPTTGQDLKLKSSMYAMVDSELIDTRFSVVELDSDGFMILSEAQWQTITELQLKPIENEILKRKLQSIQKLSARIEQKEKDIKRTERSIQKKESANQDVRSLVLQLAQVKRSLENDWQKLIKKEKYYQGLMTTHIACIKALDTIAIKKFTTTAKKLGITPIFDLVFNHLSSDAPFIRDNPDFFNLEDRTFPDATAFIYSKLLGSRRQGASGEDERREIVDKIPLIIERFWEPFIRRYILEYGFCGARVDCVRKVSHEMRLPVYELIKLYVRQSSECDAIILEETLFSDLSPMEFALQVKGAGATHNTGSVYYKDRQWHGGLPEDYSNEDFHKRSLVQNGVINFTGNHDHFTCAMTVCRQLAFERLQQNIILYAAFSEELSTKQIEYATREQSMPETCLDLLKTTYIHFYIQQIIDELLKPDIYNETVIRFGKAYRDKFLTSAFSGSGGYYMLAGDEFASLYQPHIFLREDGNKVVPDQQLKIFRSKHADVAEKILHDMADAALKRRKGNAFYKQLDKHNQAILRSPIVEHLKREINTGQESNNTQEFIIRIKKQIPKLDKLLLSYEANDHSVKNGWKAPIALRAYASTEFISEVNEIMGKLPASKEGYWSELFKARDEDLLISVRMNGFGYDGDVDIVLYNLNPYKTLSIEITDLHKIANWFRQRGFPKQDSSNIHNPDYHKAYTCIMGSSETGQPPANLYFGGNIHLDESLIEHNVDIADQKRQFNIIKQPKSSIDPLMRPPLSKVIKESDEIPQGLFFMMDTFQITQTGFVLGQSEHALSVQMVASLATGQEHNSANKRI